MAKREEIIKFLNKELNIKKIKDSSRNGLQVKGRNDIKKIAFSVDACMETFEKAKKQGCNLIIVHHGILWKGDRVPKDILNKRINYLKKNKISLYAAHLPLDLHNKYGNNIELARILNLKNIKKFGDYHGVDIGYKGKFEKPIRSDDIKKILDKKLKTKSFIIPSKNNKNIKTIGIISGGGDSELPQAIEKKLDCFLTGEPLHFTYHYAKEAGMNLIFAGHYATETVGVKALMPILKEKFGVKTIFIDIPTGL